MIRGVVATGLVLATAVESVGVEPDLVKYAVTQGGLLFVVLILLWSYRRDMQRIQEKDDEKIGLLTDLVSANTEATTKSSEATNRLIQVVERSSR